MLVEKRLILFCRHVQQIFGRMDSCGTEEEKISKYKT